MEEGSPSGAEWESSGGLRNQFETDPAVIYVLDERLRITYCNQSWDRFAKENGGWGLDRDHIRGCSFMAAIPPALQQFFEEGFEKVLTKREVFEHCYECSSPEVHRKFRMSAHPDPEGTGLVIVNSLIVEQPHDTAERPAQLPDTAVYVDAHAKITMCCHCRRTRRATQRMVWDWVPAYLNDAPVPVSHGICTVCMTLHYPDYVER